MNQHRERLNDLAPLLQDPAMKLLELCETKLHRYLLVIYTWRSIEEQTALYRMGRTMNNGTGQLEVKDASLVVTNAKPGTTAHNVVTIHGSKAAMALDVIPLNDDASVDWTPGNQFWSSLYSLAWDCGLDPLGDEVGAYLKMDKGHIEEPGWKLKLPGLDLTLPTVGSDII